jgi:hypothetical protein
MVHPMEMFCGYLSASRIGKFVEWMLAGCLGELPLQGVTAAEFIKIP